MTAAAFDALAYARKLKATGVDSDQAEAHAEAMRDAVTEGVAPEADIAELKAEIVHLGNRMFKVIVAVAAAQATLIVGLLQLL